MENQCLLRGSGSTLRLGR